MAKLTARGRRKMSRKSFAVPGQKKYPINDKAHAVAALGRVAQHGSSAEKARVRAAVRKRYPGLPSSRGKGGSKAAAANRRKRS